MDKRKHLEFIQKVIDRQAKNSFLLKGWVITLIAALFTLSGKDNVLKQVLSAYFLIFIFWLMDSYYLWQERLYRCLYDYVRKRKEDEINFDMDAKHYSKTKNNSFWDTFISKTLWMYYLPLMAITIIIFYLLK